MLYVWHLMILSVTDYTVWVKTYLPTSVKH